MSRRKSKSKPGPKGLKTKNSHSEAIKVCPACKCYPCQDLKLGCELWRGKKVSKNHRSKYEFCFECEEVTEIQYDANRHEYFCKSCGSTSEEDMINLPESVKKGSSAQSGSNYNGNWQGSNNWPPACEHKGDKVIFEFEGKKLYAANNKGINEFSGAWELIIDLGQIIPIPSPGFIKTVNHKKYDALRKYTGKYTEPKSEILRLDWPDYSAPAVTPDFWLELWRILPEKTCICCVGGHGRTGTCLAAFLIAIGEVDYYSAFTTVRTEHCEKAIESVAQARYLHGLYTDLLKRKLVVATSSGDFIAAATLQESLKYASEHLPTSSDLLGGDEVETTIKTSAKGYQDTKSSDSEPKDKINYPKRQCPSCSAWIERAVHFNDYYWCETCKKSVGSASKIDTGEDFEQPLIKRVNGVLYVKECCDPACKWSGEEDCEDPDHLAWIKWDDWQFMEARVS